MNQKCQLWLEELALKDVLASPHFHQCLRTDLTDPRLIYR